MSNCTFLKAYDKSNDIEMVTCPLAIFCIHAWLWPSVMANAPMMAIIWMLCNQLQKEKQLDDTIKSRLTVKMLLNPKLTKFGIFQLVIELHHFTKKIVATCVNVIRLISS